MVEVAIKLIQRVERDFHYNGKGIVVDPADLLQATKEEISSFLEENAYIVRKKSYTLKCKDYNEFIRKCTGISQKALKSWYGQALIPGRVHGRQVVNITKEILVDFIFILVNTRKKEMKQKLVDFLIERSEKYGLFCD